MADTTRKIIRGIVNSRGFTITSPITQWDYGWQFIPEIEDLPPTYRLDFSNEEKRGTALPVYCSTDGAEVPTELIDTGKDIWVWYVAIGDGYGITEYKWRIPNKCKPKTEEDEPTPTQQSSIDQLIVRSNEAVESAEQSASAADQSAQNASADADRAEEARTDAQNFATQAETSADNASSSASQASASATASAQSASQSAQIKSDVEGMVDDAQASASASAQSASASANSASQASGYAQSASASAQSASGYASQAQTSAQTASNKASEARGYASTASQKATESAQSATNAQGYAQTAESAKVASQTAQGLAESARDTAVSAKNDAESARDDAESARDEAQNIVDGISEALDDKAPVITDTASGSIASFSDGADDLPLKSLVVNIGPVQDLSHGNPSPENICPISGWTQVQTTQAGSNLWNPVPNGMAKWNPSIGEQISSLTTNFTTFENDVLSVNTNWAWNGNAFITNKLLTGRTYRVTGVVNSNSNRARVGIYTLDANRRVVRIVRYVTNNGNIDVSVTIGASDVCICVSAANATDNEAVTITNPCISENGIYEPYTGRSITIDLGQTVYGGKLDVLSGILTVYPYYASYNGETLTGEWISDRDVYAVGTTPTIGAQVVNIGAQGVTVQLSANQLNSLYGVNNIWADSGDTEVEYRANTKLYIAKKIAEAISALS